MRKIYIKYVPYNLHKEIVKYKIYPGMKLNLVRFHYVKHFTIIEGNLYTVGEFKESYGL